jgi:hypothetical protein
MWRWCSGTATTTISLWAPQILRVSLELGSSLGKGGQAWNHGLGMREGGVQSLEVGSRCKFLWRLRRERSGWRDAPCSPMHQSHSSKSAPSRSCDGIESATALHLRPNANTRFLHSARGVHRDLAKKGSGPSALHPPVLAILGQRTGGLIKPSPAKEESSR